MAKRTRVFIRLITQRCALAAALVCCGCAANKSTPKTDRQPSATTSDLRHSTNHLDELAKYPRLLSVSCEIGNSAAEDHCPSLPYPSLLEQISALSDTSASLQKAQESETDPTQRQQLVQKLVRLHQLILQKKSQAARIEATLRDLQPDLYSVDEQATRDRSQLLTVNCSDTHLVILCLPPSHDDNEGLQFLRLQGVALQNLSQDLQNKESLLASIPDPGMVRDAAFVQERRVVQSALRTVGAATSLKAQHLWALQKDAIAKIWRPIPVSFDSSVDMLLPLTPDNRTPSESELGAITTAIDHLQEWQKISHQVHGLAVGKKIHQVVFTALNSQVDQNQNVQISLHADLRSVQNLLKSIPDTKKSGSFFSSFIHPE